MNKFKEIFEVLWLLLNAGFWRVLASYHGLRVRYLKWCKKRVKKEHDKYTIKLKDVKEEVQILEKETSKN